MRSLVRGIASACIRQGACARHPEPTYQAASHSAPRARLARITGLAWMFLLCFVRCETAETWETGVDFTRTNGAFRALHGVNKGPLGPGGLINLTAEHRELGIPYTRLHDCYWPNPYVVDIHAVFPDFHADPSKAESYDFRLTDEYLSAVVASGARIVYRLGESIEHTSVRRFAHPPPDPRRWAAICLGIIRHYNEGWAEGFHHGIVYWEIWNEPENRPAMWSGTDEDYLELYRVTARAIRREFPGLRIGGPAVGASGRFVDGTFQPTEFVLKFLDTCRSEGLPLDFFSWHCYTSDPSELVTRARAIRRLLDDRGFGKTESHLNEWNFLPGDSWEPLFPRTPARARQEYFETMSGAEGAAFVATALLELQDAPVDVANLFHGELGMFGLFNEFGVPRKNYHALLAFNRLLQTPRRAETSGVVPGRRAIAAGLNAAGTQARVLLTSRDDSRLEVRIDLSGLPWAGDTRVEVRAVDREHDFEIVATEVMPAAAARQELGMNGPAVILIALSPAEGGARDPQAAHPAGRDGPGHP